MRTATVGPITNERVTRRLAAIFAADMVGFSRLIEGDEEGTIARQKTHRKELIDPKISEHGGRIVKTTGDGLLAEFPSVVDAVRCAVEMQQAITERETSVPDDRRIAYRVAVNLGDIVIDGDDVMGEGVNIAARLEALAKPGEVLISGTAFDQLKKKLEYGYRFQGERKVKNIAEPIRIYGVLPDTAAGTVLGRRRVSPTARRWIAGTGATLVLAAAAGLAWWQPWRTQIESDRLTQLASPSPKLPTIAVLPFTNLSGDKNQEYFADGMTDDLITGLSKISGLIVVSRTSTFTFKGTKQQTKDIARTLGVRYVLEGSVRRADGIVRINAQLIDATTGGHVWAETFNRKYVNVFALQDEVKGQIVQALKVKLTAKEQAQLKRKPTSNLEAYDHYLKAERLRLTLDWTNYLEAFALFDKALTLDPDFVDAHVGNAKASFRAWRLGWRLITDAKARSQRSLAKALALDPDNAGALTLQALMQLHFGNYDVAQSVARGAVSRHPRDPNLRAMLARVLLASDRLDEARDALRRAESGATGLSPEWIAEMAQDYLMLGDAKRAVPLLLRARKLGSSRFTTAMLLTNGYAQLDRLQLARAEFETAKKTWPDANVGYLRRSHAYFRNKRLLKAYLDAFLKAGIPEKY